MQQVNNQIQFKSSILKLQELAQIHFTGSLLIQNNTSRWKIYFRLGRLIWLRGEGNYFKYQWKRHIRLFLSDLSIREQEYLLKESQDKCYKRLVKLYNQKTSKNRENITNLITNLSVEVIFDLIQYESTNINKLSYQMIANDKIENIISFTKIDVLYSIKTFE